MTLEEVRRNIDKVDSEIKKLFAQRMELADNVARVKAETGDEIFKPDREEAIISNLTQDVGEHIRKEYIALIKRIMEISRKYQYGRTLELRDCFDVDYVEKEPTVSKVAMIKPELYICDMISKDKVVTVDSFEEVGEQITHGQVDAGVGILEDVSVQAADEIHNMLVRKHLYINRCHVVEDSGIRKKVVLFTRQLVVTTEHNRIKVMFVCKNKSGSLASILSMISDYGVNLTEIHSKPNREAEWNYEFFLEFDGNLLKQEIQALVFQLMNETQYFQILGSYYCEGDF